jgi:hypothetical protein
MGLSLAISNGKSAFIWTCDNLLLLDLPPFSDCTVHQLVQLSNRLPEDLCLGLDRQAGRFHIFQVSDAVILDGRKASIIQNTSALNVADNPSGETFEAQGEQTRQRRISHPTGDLFVIHRVLAIEPS